MTYATAANEVGPNVVVVPPAEELAPLGPPPPQIPGQEAARIELLEAEILELKAALCAASLRAEEGQEKFDELEMRFRELLSNQQLSNEGGATNKRSRESCSTEAPDETSTDVPQNDMMIPQVVPERMPSTSTILLVRVFAVTGRLNEIITLCYLFLIKPSRDIIETFILLAKLGVVGARAGCGGGGWRSWPPRAPLLWLKVYSARANLMK